MTDEADAPRPKPARAGETFPPPPVPADAPPPKPAKPTKAERLEAKAARLRAAAEQRPAQGTAPAPTGWIVATAVLAALCAGLITLSVLLYLSREHQKDATNASRALRADAVEVAKTFALDFGAYDYRHLDQDFAEVATRMTPSFAKSYLDTSNQLKPTFLQYKTQVTARLQGYGLTSATKTHATVVVFLDQTVRTTQSSTPRIDRNRLEVQLVRVKGKWLVAKLLAK